MIEQAVISAFPASWRRERLGSLTWVRARLGWKGLTADEYVDSGIPMLATPNIKGAQIDFASANRITVQRYEESPEIKLRVGDVLLTKDGSTIGIANVVRSLPEPATVNGSIAVLTPNERLDSAFLLWLLQSNEYQALMRSWQDGMGVPHLFQSDIKRIPVALPSTQEQRAIADYLDRETAQIDAFVAKNEELMSLLTERRAAVIAKMVTQGADGSAGLRVSGVEWAGDVPDTWRLGNIRRFASMKTGHTPSRQHPEYWVNCEIPWFTLADVWQLRQGRREIDETSERISELGLANSAAELLPAGTVALSRTASVGFAGIMPVAMATSQDFWNWVPGEDLLAEYLWYQFQAMKPEFERLMTGSTHRTIYQADAASFTVLVPPMTEQREIVERLDGVTRRIDDAVRTARRGVELARERRAALISAAVTGKIDVGVAA